jgi:hypothetical protein
MWTQLGKEILWTLPECTVLCFGCVKEMGNFLIESERSIYKVQCVSWEVVVVTWLVRILQKSITLIFTVSLLLYHTVIAGPQCQRRSTYVTCNDPQIPTVPPRVVPSQTTTTATLYYAVTIHQIGSYQKTQTNAHVHNLLCIGLSASAGKPRS